MEYVYAALILHESDSEITEERLTNVLDAAGVDPDESRIKALVAALEDVDIEEAMAQPMQPVAAGGPAAGAPEEEAPEEEAVEDEAEAEEPEDEDEEGSAEDGLGQLFG